MAGGSFEEFGLLFTGDTAPLEAAMQSMFDQARANISALNDIPPPNIAAFATSQAAAFAPAAGVAATDSENAAAAGALVGSTQVALGGADALEAAGISKEELRTAALAAYGLPPDALSNKSLAGSYASGINSGRAETQAQIDAALGEQAAGTEAGAKAIADSTAAFEEQAAEASVGADAIASNIAILQSNINVQRDILAKNAIIFDGTETQAQLVAEDVALSVQVNDLKKGIRDQAAQQLAAQTASTEAGGAGALDAIGAGAVGSTGLGALGTIAPAIAAFAAIGGLAASVKDANDLQKILVQVGAELDSFGKGDQLASVNNQILTIARNTGEASTAVAQVALQFIGAFGGNTQQALQQTEQAIEVVRVTGLSLSDVTNSFIALTQAYKDQGVEISNVSDAALGLQERTGTLAADTITFASELAPVGEQLGFTVQQLEALGATAEEFSGKSGAALAESFSRLLPELQANSSKVLQAFQTIGTGGGQVISQLSAEFNNGNIAAALNTLALNWDKLSTAEQNNLVTALGGQRNASALLAVLANSKSYLDNQATAQNSAGKTAEYYGATQATLTQQLARLGEALKQIGIDLVQGGLGNVLQDLGIGLAIILSPLQILLKLFDALNQATHGWSGELVGIAGSLLIAAAAYNKLNGFIGNYIKSRAESAGTTTEDAAAQNELTGSLVAQDEALLSNTAETEANAAAKALDGGATYAPGGGAALSGAEAEAAYGGAGATNSAAAVGGLYEGEGAAAGGGGLLAGVSPVIPVIGATAAVAILGKTIADQHAKLGDAAKSLYDESVTKPAAELQKILDSGVGNQSTLEKIGDFIGGTSGPNDAIRNAIQAQLVKPRTEALKALQDGLKGASDKTRDQVQSLIDGQAGLTVDTGDNGNLATGEQEAKAIQPLIDDLKKNPHSKALIDEYNGLLNGIKKIDPQLAKAMEEAFSGTDKDVQDALSGHENASKQTKQSLEDIATLTTDLSTLATELQNGNGDLHEYIAKAAQLEQQYQEVIKNESGKQKATDLAAYQQIVQSTGKIISDAIQQQADVVNKINTDSGSYQGAAGVQSQIAAVQAELNNPLFTDPKDRLTAAESLVSLQQQLLQTEIKDATSVAQASKLIKNGLAIPADVQAQLVSAQIDPNINPQVSAFIDVVSKISGQSSDQVLELLKEYLLGNDNAGLILLTDLQQEATRVSEGLQHGGDDPGGKAAAYLNQLNSEIAALQNQKSADAAFNVSIPGSVQVTDKAQALKDQQAKATAYQDAIFGYYSQLAAGDPQKQAAIAVQQAEFDLSQAQKGTTDYVNAQKALVAAQQAQVKANNDVQNAQDDLSAASVAGDPVKSAQAGLKKAQDAAAQAQGKAAQLEAAAQEISANTQLEKAINDVYNSYTDVLIAQANMAGNSVLAAQLGLKKAQDELAQVEQLAAQGQAGTKDINAAQANLDAAQAAVAQAEVSTAESNAQFLYDMGQITITQFINLLEQAKADAKGNQTLIQQIDEQIKQLQNQAGTDLQFNLPTNIDLPNLYESRGLAGSSGQSLGNNPTIGVQNTGPVTVNINVANQNDVAGVQAAVASALGAPSTVSNVRLY